ncbi:MBL fold metallo-hydrolase [Amycolatopsis sp. cmx-4-68]|uniref:MBL fold metallo-hydrolase n=1 Tax=Amycolatopsis sp. cmx-4-68 TaxID=2790938 RepID=UPI00397BA6B0
MDIVHFGHACVLLELDSARVLIDPGTYSAGFEDLRDLDLVLLTHAHPDHLDLDRLGALLARNPRAVVVHSPGAAAALADLPGLVAVPGDELSPNGILVTVTGSGTHACVHPDLPGSDNNGYLIDGVLHPGDAFDPLWPVDVLLVPAGGPWMKLMEGVDYVRELAPRIAIPIHQAGLATAHQNLHHRVLTELAPAGTEVIVLEHARARTLR